MPSSEDIITIIGAILNAGSTIYGAQNQSNTNSNNLAAQQQRYQQLLAMIGGQMQAGQNPYAAAQLQYLGFNPAQFMSPQQYQMPNVPGQTQQYSGPSVPLDTNLGDNIANAPTGPTTEQGGANSGPALQPAGGSAWLQAASAPPNQYWPDNTPTPTPTPATPTVPIVPGGQIITDPGLGGGLIPGTPLPPFTGPTLQPPTPITGGGYTPGQLGSAPQLDLAALFPQLQALLGAAPQMGAATGVAPQLGDAAQMQAGNVGQTPIVDAAQAGAPRNVQAGQIQGPSAINLPTISAPTITGTQGANAGQDALMQMMRAPIGPGQQTMQNLNQIGSGNTEFDNSELFSSLQAVNHRNLDQQVAELYGSRGSLGKILGSNTQRAESNLRENFAQDQSLQNAQIASSSFEAAQNRRMPALSQLAALPFQSAQLQQQAASAAAGFGLQQAGMNQQAKMANQSTQLAANQSNLQALLQAALQTQHLGTQTGSMNAANALQAALANQQTRSQLGQFNAGQQNQMGQFNASNALQAMFQNAQMGQQASQFNTGQQNQFLQQNQQSALQMAMQNSGFQQQANQFNAGQQSQYGLAALQAAMQGGQLNQQLASQYGLTEYGAQNAASQFNAGQSMQAQMANQQFMNQYQQMIQQGLGQAYGYQQGQGSLNSQLLGLLAGIGVPSQQPSPWAGAGSDLSSLMMLLPQFMGLNGGGGNPATTTPWAPTGYTANPTLNTPTYRGL